MMDAPRDSSARLQRILEDEAVRSRILLLDSHDRRLLRLRRISRLRERGVSLRALGLAAAVLLVILGAGAWFLRPQGPAAPPAERYAADLAARFPARFRGFELPCPQRLSPTLGDERKMVAVSPAGTFARCRVYDLRPTFRWEGSHPSKLLLRLRDPVANKIWEEEVQEGPVAFPESRPDLVPGESYFWELVPRDDAGPFGPRLAYSEVFEVATTAERHDYEEARDIIADQVPSPWSHLLLAQYSFQERYLDEARSALSLFRSERPRDPLGLQLELLLQDRRP